MYHSVNIGDINTYDDWHLVATSRPVIAMPTPKTQYIDIPGANGTIDLSSSLTGYPVFNDRTGSLEFYVLNDYQSWTDLHDKIASYLHGKRLRLSLEDDPKYYYEGRLKFNSWKSEKSYSRVIIDYTLDPYKYCINNSYDDWLWDPFDFEDDAILEAFFKNIIVNDDTAWAEYDFEGDLFGYVPVTPTFIVESESGMSGVDMRFVCEGEGIDTTIHLLDGETMSPDMYFNNSDVKIYFKGTAKVSIKFRGGRL